MGRQSLSPGHWIFTPGSWGAQSLGTFLAPSSSVREDGVTGNAAQVVDPMPDTHRALGSVPSIDKSGHSGAHI